MSRKKTVAIGAASAAAVAAALAATVPGHHAPPAATRAAATPAAHAHPIATHPTNAGSARDLSSADAAKAETTTPAAVINQISGSGGVIDFSGPANQIALNQLQGLATDAAGNLYVANTYDNQVGKISAPSTWTPENALGGATGQLGWSNALNASSVGNSTVTPTTVNGNSAINWTWSPAQPDAWIQVSPGLTTGTTYTASVTLTGQGQVYLDFYNGQQDVVSKTVTLSSTPQTVQVTTTIVSGNAPQYQIRTPSGSSQASIDVTAWNASIVSDPATLTGQGTLIAGHREFVTKYNSRHQALDLGNGLPGPKATLNTPSAVAVDGKGDVFIADTQNNMIREVTPNGIIHDVAGTGKAGYSGDGGRAVDAELDNPSGVAVNSKGDLFIADTYNNVIREVTPDGRIETVAGNPHHGGYSGNGGPAAKALLRDPQGISVDSRGDLFIADSGNSVIREITTAGVIKTVAGEPDKFGFNGDGAAATSAELSGPTDVAVDAAGDLYIADTGNNALREVSAKTGDISTIAGANGEGNNGQGGPAASAQLDGPEGVAVDSSTGDVYVTSRSGVLDQITGLPASS